jgi:hypothetical protein
MMTDNHPQPDYHEITELSNSELANRTQAALDTFIEAIKEGRNVAEKAQLYNAYQDERLRRLTAKKLTVDSNSDKPAKTC